MGVYRKVRDLREDNDKTQRQIAEYLNMQLTVYQRYERGEREPDNTTLKLLSKYFNASIDYILCND